MRIEYAHEKYVFAVAGMATSPKSIQGRIEEAFEENLNFVGADDVPPDLRERHVALTGRLRLKPGQVASMGAAEAVEIAKEIVFLADRIEEAFRAKGY